jgi:peptidoglycan/LPS O-acetylase OafA/YrhL
MHAEVVSTGMAALFGFGNAFLYFIQLNYFRAEEYVNAFSHTWSLGVEEQFYVIFAILVIALPVAVFPRNRTRTARFWILLLLTVVSFGMFVFSSRGDLARTYYLVASRLWEIGLGCILALLLSDAKPGRIHPRILDLLQVAGVAGLLASMFILAPSDFGSPRRPIAVAAASTCVLLVTGALGSPVIARALSIRAAVWIGLISYSLYLWHWPVFAYFRYTVGLASSSETALALALILSLAWASYHFVEQRARRSKKPFRSYLLPRFALAFAATTAVGGIILAKPGIIYLGEQRDWVAESPPRRNASVLSDGRLRHEDCSTQEGGVVPSRLPATCFAVARSVPPTLPVLLLLGDSHAGADWRMVAYGAESGAFNLATFPHFGCSANVVVEIRNRSCRIYWDWLPELIRNELRAGDAAMLAFLWYWEPNADYEPIARTLPPIARAAADVGATLIVEAPLPRFPRPGYSCTPAWFRTMYEGCTIPRARFERVRARAMKALDDVVRAHPNVKVWDPAQLLCTPDCSTHRDNVPLFTDNDHISYPAADALGPHFVRFLAGVLDQRPQDRGPQILSRSSSPASTSRGREPSGGPRIPAD